MPQPARVIFQELPPPPRRASLAPVARLAHLHEEFATAAQLGQFLSRAAYAAYVLLVACAALVALCAGAVASMLLAVWAFFVCAGAIGIFLVARLAERMGPELLTLRALTHDLNAMLLYAGFAWGSGAFLLNDVLASPLLLLSYAAGVATAALTVLGAGTSLTLFISPLHVLCAAAVWSAGGTLLGSFAILLLNGLLAAAGALMERRRERVAAAPRLFSAASPA